MMRGMDRQALIAQIEAYSRASGYAPSTICQYAVRNRNVYARLTAGKSCTTLTAERLTAWMRDNPPKAK
jgi:hypothetical protein